jgi:hypothetical protein
MRRAWFENLKKLISFFNAITLFTHLVIFLNLALALLGQGLKKSPIGQKLDFANHSYLCKGLYKVVLDNINDNGYKKSKTVYMVNNTHNKQHSFVVLLSEPLGYSNFIMV